MLRIALISDTHGLLRPAVADFLRGSDHIVHAGDICDPQLLARLSAIAPVTAVRGNNDHGPWAEQLPCTARVTLGGVHLHVIHDIARLDIDPEAAGVDVVVSGHSHRPSIERRGAVLHVNPGSPGPRRFSLPISVAELLVDDGIATARVQEFTAEGRTG